MEKIDILAPLQNQYGVISLFTKELAEALKRQGLSVRLIESDYHNPKEFFDQILKNKPDCTLSFNGLLPGNEGQFLCDLIRIPHVAYLTDAPPHFFPLALSPRTIVVSIDQDFYQMFRQFRFPHVLFLPHAVSQDLQPAKEFVPLYDVIMLNTYVDYEVIQQKWHREYSAALAEILEESAEWTLSDLNIPYMQAFIQTMNKHLKRGNTLDPRQINYPLIFDELGAYLGGKSQMELLQAIEEVDVHVFGAPAGSIGWKKHLKNKDNIKVHEAIPFSKALDLMKRSKFVLHATPQIKRGAHERVLSGLACGSAVLALASPFLKENFQDEREILLYAPRRWDEVNRKLRIYLQDDNRRLQLAAEGRKKVLRFHTWDERAKVLIQQLPPILETIGRLTDA